MPSPPIWPALVIGGLQAVVYFGPSVAAKYELSEVAASPFSTVVAGFLGPVVCGAALLGWWLVFSRRSWRERLLGGFAFAGVMLSAFLVVHPSMRMGIGFYVLPSVTSVLVVVLLLTQSLKWSIVRWLAVGGMAATVGVWALVRNDGLYGDFEVQLAWRWAPTAEQDFLAQRDRTSVVANGDAGSLFPPHSVESGSSDWPGFRGPVRDGVVRGVSFPTDWRQIPPRELWRQRVGPGWSSFAVVGDCAFTQEQRGEDEVGVCYHAATGRELWATPIKARFEETVGGPGPRATPTYFVRETVCTWRDRHTAVPGSRDRQNTLAANVN